MLQAIGLVTLAVGFFNKYIRPSQVNAEVAKAFALKRIYEISNINVVEHQRQKSAFKSFNIVFDFSKLRCSFSGDFGSFLSTILGTSSFDIIDFKPANECTGVLYSEENFSEIHVNFDGNW